MADWQSICDELSLIFQQNSSLNFGINLTSDEVAQYIIDKALLVRIGQTNAGVIEAAFFVTNDGECGFVAMGGLSHSVYRYLIEQFNSFVLELPENLKKNLWCRVQPDNLIVQKLVSRLGFIEHQRTDTSIYYKYGG